MVYATIENLREGYINLWAPHLQLNHCLNLDNVFEINALLATFHEDIRNTYL